MSSTKREYTMNKSVLAVLISTLTSTSVIADDYYVKSDSGEFVLVPETKDDSWFGSDLTSGISLDGLAVSVGYGILSGTAASDGGANGGISLGVSYTFDNNLILGFQTNQTKDLTITKDTQYRYEREVQTTREHLRTNIIYGGYVFNQFDLLIGLGNTVGSMESETNTYNEVGDLVDTGYIAGAKSIINTTDLMLGINYHFHDNLFVGINTVIVGLEGVKDDSYSSYHEGNGLLTTFNLGYSF